jgi:hypothetical protein
MSRRANDINWDFLKPYYLAGQLSDRQIVDVYNTIRDGGDKLTSGALDSHARRHGWTRGTSRGLVRQATEEKLVKADAPGVESKDQVVDLASDVAVDIILNHRSLFLRMRRELTRVLERVENRDTYHIPLKNGGTQEMKPRPVDEAKTIQMLTRTLCQLVEGESKLYRLEGSVDQDEATGLPRSLAEMLEKEYGHVRQLH